MKKIYYLPFFLAIFFESCLSATEIKIAVTSQEKISIHPLTINFYEVSQYLQGLVAHAPVNLPSAKQIFLSVLAGKIVKKIIESRINARKREKRKQELRKLQTQLFLCMNPTHQDYDPNKALDIAEQMKDDKIIELVCDWYNTEKEYERKCIVSEIQEHLYPLLKLGKAALVLCAIPFFILKFWF